MHKKQKIDINTLAKMYEVKPTFKKVQRKVKGELRQGYMTPKRFYLEGEFEGTYLTPQEALCLLLLSKTGSYKKVSQQLELSYHTIYEYLQKVREKLGCKDKADLKELLEGERLKPFLKNLANILSYDKEADNEAVNKFYLNIRGEYPDGYKDFLEHIDWKNRS